MSGSNRYIKLMLFFIACICASVLAFKPFENPPTYVSGEYALGFDSNRLRDFPTTGSCGLNLTWTYDTSNKKLTISGFGPMDNYTNATPWGNFAPEMTTIVVNGAETIGNYAFMSCSELTSISLAASVTVIGIHAFSSCHKLATVNLGNNVNLKIIDTAGFFNDVKLSSITLPNSLERIESDAFAYSALTSISIPASVSYISDYAFEASQSLTSINVNANNEKYKSIDGILFNKNGDELIAYPAGKTGNNYAYTISADIKRIGWAAFFLTRLNTINVDASNAKYSSQNGVLFNKDATTLITFPCGKGGDSYTIPSTVTTLEYRSFYSSNVKAVVIPEGVKFIGSSCFYNSQKLTELTIPASVTTVSASFAAECKLITAFSVRPNNTAVKAVDGVLFDITGETLIQYPLGKAATHYDIPYGVKTVNTQAFRSCNLETVTIPPTVETLEDYAFHHSTSLKSVVIPASVHTIGAHMFSSGSSLTSITFLGYVDELDVSILSWCYALTSITYLGKTQPQIPYLYGVTLSDAVCVIPEYQDNSFCGLSNLKKSLSCEINTINKANIDSTAGFKELIDIASNGPFDFDINLNLDLDFGNGGMDLTLPLGMSQSGTCNWFSGTFRGNKYSVKNLQMKNNGEVASLFCGLDNAVIENLEIESSCVFEGNKASGLSLSAQGTVLLSNVKNKGKVVGVLGGSGLVHSVIERNTNLTLINCVNLGDVVVSDGEGCGLYCSESTTMLTNVYNSMNAGSVEGKIAYGVSNRVKNADNVVSKGMVEGADESYSLWINSTDGVYSSVFGVEGSCHNCGDFAILMMKDAMSDLFYVGDSNKMMRADGMLNEESVANNYGFYWSKDFAFVDNLVVSAKTSDGTIQRIVPYDGVLGDIQELRPYLDETVSDEYIVTDLYLKSIVYTLSTVIKNDMMIAVKKMREAEDDDITIVIEIEPSILTMNASKIETLAVVCMISGFDAELVSITIEYDEKGQATEVIINVKEEETAKVITDSVNSIERGESCTAGVLCRTKRIYIKDKSSKQEEYWIEAASRKDRTMMTALVSFFILFLINRC